MRLLSATAFPDKWAGRLSHCAFRGLLGVSLRAAARRVAEPGSPRLLSEGLHVGPLPDHHAFVATKASRRLLGRDLPPLENSRLSRRSTQIALVRCSIRCGAVQSCSTVRRAGTLTGSDFWQRRASPCRGILGGGGGLRTPDSAGMNRVLWPPELRRRAPIHYNREGRARANDHLPDPRDSHATKPTPHRTRARENSEATQVKPGWLRRATSLSP